MEDNLSYIYENSTCILDLIEKRKISYNDIKRMIFNGDNSIKQRITYHESDLVDDVDQFLDSKKLINLLAENTLLRRKKDLLEDIERLFNNYYMSKIGAVSMDTKQLLLEKFIYLFNNIEIIADFLDASNCNLSSHNFRIQQLEDLLMQYKFINEDENISKIERYKKVSDNVSSYNIINRVNLTKIVLDNLQNYIKSQKNDVHNKTKKLKVMEKYYQLLSYIQSNEVMKVVCIKTIDTKDKKSLKQFLNTYILTSINCSTKNDNTSLCGNMGFLRDVNDVGVSNNNFINNNVIVDIDDSDKNLVLEAVKREENYIKRLRYNIY